MNPEGKARYEVAVTAAREAGRIARVFFPDSTAAEFAKQIEFKADASPVTIADRAAETCLRETILGRFPRDGFVGEEFGTIDGTSGFRWIVDPIDGTRSFVRGIPLWGTLVGLESDGELIAGVVVEPALGNTYRAMRGDGAYKNDRRIRVSNVDRLADTILCTSDFNSFHKADRLSAYLSLAKQVQRQRGYGDYFGFTLVAQGSADLMLDFGVHSWDIAAVIPLIEEAGGTFTDWTGRQSLEQPDALATNGKLHQAALDILKNAS
ncbi:MAG: histidinol phosphate phosphatase [Gemmataceae bacterium]|nr:histidinol phosphate phosphatase [Gemmataceae bacterium]